MIKEYRIMIGETLFMTIHTRYLAQAEAILIAVSKMEEFEGVNFKLKVMKNG